MEPVPIAAPFLCFSVAIHAVLFLHPIKVNLNMDSKADMKREKKDEESGGNPYAKLDVTAVLQEVRFKAQSEISSVFPYQIYLKYPNICKKNNVFAVPCFQRDTYQCSQVFHHSHQAIPSCPTGIFYSYFVFTFITVILGRQYRSH